MGKAERDRSARERLAAERAKQAAREKRNRGLLIGLGALVAIAVVVVAVVLVRSGGDEDGGYKGALAPTSRQSDGSVAMAKAGVTKPVLEVYEDFQCPACKKLEDTQGPTIKQLAAEGKVKVVYRPFQLFQQEPLSGNSVRAANAAACAPGDKWLPYHDKIYANQPEEGVKGFSNEDLIKWAGEVGISGDAFTKCVNGGEQKAAVQRATAYATQQKVESTLTLMLDGQRLDDNAAFTPDGLKKAVEEAGKKDGN